MAKLATGSIPNEANVSLKDSSSDCQRDDRGLVSGSSVVDRWQALEDVQKMEVERIHYRGECDCHIVSLEQQP